MKISFLTCLTLLLPFVNLAQKGPSTYANTITVKDLKAHLSIIASDSFQGRKTGEVGQKLAASYIAREFRSIGLKPVVQMGDSFSYYQKFQVLKRTWDAPTLKIGNEELRFPDSFFSIGNPNLETSQELELVYGGFDMEEITLRGERIKGKAIVVNIGDVKDRDPSVYRQKVHNLILTSNYNRKYRQMLDSGARAIFVFVGPEDSLFQNFVKKHKCELEKEDIFMQTKKTLFNNIFFIPPSVACLMLRLSKEKLAALQRKEAGINKEEYKEIKSQRIEIKAFRKTTPLPTENILGVIEGSDKKDEVLIISAHYDHEGIYCGEIYNGADDDGTGTVSVIELAEAFQLAKMEGNGPRRSILFMAVTGEEEGLLGSSYYTQHPIFPLTQTIADLNIDMIGRVDNKHKDENYVYIIGSDRLSRELHDINESANKKFVGLQLDYTYNKADDPNQFYYRSDHYNFAKNNIPVIFYFSGVHEDYHEPTDDISKILFGKVEKTAKLVFYTAWELANKEERIVVDMAK